jgi:glycosyltransferase involved in cell wall biosynthesis
MRLVMLADAYLPDESTGINGTQVQMYNLAHAFARRGIDVHYVCLTGETSPPACDTSGVTIHWIRQRGRRGPGFDWFHHMGEFRRELDRIAPDVVYQRGRSYLTYVAATWAQRSKGRFVWGTNGEDSAEYWRMTGKLKGSGRAFWKKALLLPTMIIHDSLIHRGVRGAALVINQTDYQRQRLLTNYGKKGIVLPSFTLPPIYESTVEKERIVLWLATLSPDKQPELFLDLAEQCRDLDGWLFVLAGDTADREYYERIAQRASRLGNVRLEGAVPFNESHRLYASAALYAHTSRKDGVPNAFIQSWLNSTPVLSLNFDPDGWIQKHGLGLFASGDTDRFVGMARTFLKNYGVNNHMGGASAKFARQKFSDEATIDSYIEFFSRKRMTSDAAA